MSMDSMTVSSCSPPKSIWATSICTGGLGQALSEYQTEFARLREINDRIGALSADEAEKAHKTDLLTYQINEITEAALTSGEEEELLSQRRILRIPSGSPRHWQRHWLC